MKTSGVFLSNWIVLGGRRVRFLVSEHVHLLHLVPSRCMWSCCPLPADLVSFLSSSLSDVAHRPRLSTQTNFLPVYFAMSFPGPSSLLGLSSPFFRILNYFLCFFFFLREGLTLYLRLSLNSQQSPASAYRVLGLQVCTTVSSSVFITFIYLFILAYSILSGMRNMLKPLFGP